MLGSGINFHNPDHANREAAAALNELGKKAFERGDFQTAFDFFEKAFRLTDENDLNRETYRVNKERARAAKLKQDGDIICEGDPKEAMDKYHQAIKTLQPFVNSSRIETDMKLIKKNMAKLNYEQGRKFFNQQKFQDALKYFTEAAKYDSRNYQKHVDNTNDAIKNEKAEKTYAQGEKKN